MTVVAWVSRHDPLPAQIFELEKKLGDVNIVRISKTFRNVLEVYAEVKSCGAEYAVVVLPMSMISVLTQKGNDVTWLWAEMESVHQHSCPGESCPEYNPEYDVILESPEFNRHLRFKEFRRIVRVEMVTEPWR